MAKIIEYPYYPQPGGQEQLWRGLGKKEPASTIMFHGPRGIGKTIKNNSLVELFNGNYKKIIDIKQGDLVASLNPKGYLEPKVVTELFTSEKKRFYKLITETGLEIEAGYTHRLYTDKGWLCIDQLKKGGFIAISRRGVFGSGEDDIDLIRLYALAIGDGCLHDRNKHITIGSIYPEYQHEMQRICKKMGYTCRLYEDNSVVPDRTRTAPVLYHTIYGGINSRMIEDGMKVGSKEKFIPGWILALKREQLSEFMKYLFATDASFHFDGRKFSIQYSTVSKKLAHDIAFALRKFGIVARIQKTVSQRRGKVFGDLYVVCIKERNAVKTFLSDIGVFGERHKKWVEGGREFLEKDVLSGGKDIIPVTITRPIAELIEMKSNHPQYEKRKALLGKSGKKGTIQRESVERFSKAMENQELMDLSSNDIYWDRIASIVQTEDDIGYDFEVQDNHNYIANGIVSHNSYGLRSAFASILAKYPLEACIVRKTYTDLRENHVIPMRNELKEFIDRKIIKLNMGELAYIFPNGSRLQFQYCMRDADLDRFQGRSYDLMGIEEAGQFTEHQIVVMLAANRASPTAGKYHTVFPQKAALTFNWGGPGHRYLKRLAHDKIFLPEKGESAEKFLSIIGKYDENKIFQQLDPNYQDRLRRLPLQLQRAWIDGDPDAFTGTVFAIVDPAHEVDPNKLLRNHSGLVPVSWQLFGALDPGTSAPCSFGLYTKTPDGQIYKIFNYYERDRNPEQHSFAILDAIKTCKWTNGRMPSYIVSGSDAFNRKNKRDIYAHDVTWKDVFRERGLYLARTDTGGGSRRRSYHAMQMLLHYEYSPITNEFTKLPKLRFFKGACKATLDELRELEGSEYDPEDIKQGNEVADHAYDETRYAIMGAATPMAAEDPDDENNILELAYRSEKQEEYVEDPYSLNYAWDETF